jgi:HEAT repeat protein
VSLLTRDLEIVPGRFEPGGFAKMAVMVTLTCRDIDDYGWGNDQKSPERDEALRRVLAQLSEDDWRPVLEHSRHEREGVRAGSFLLLCHHPDRETVLRRAKEALQDPSRLVRLASAATLAYHRDASGVEALVDGLDHERWEVRWWCARCLAYFADPAHLQRLQALTASEPDPFVRDEVSKMERVWRP